MRAQRLTLKPFSFHPSAAQAHHRRSRTRREDHARSHPAPRRPNREWRRRPGFDRGRLEPGLVHLLLARNGYPHQVLDPRCCPLFRPHPLNHNRSDSTSFRTDTESLMLNQPFKITVMRSQGSRWISIRSGSILARSRGHLWRCRIGHCSIIRDQLSVVRVFGTRSGLN
jgi:hypothetical protein